jgi:hypothetical protein
MEKEFGMNNNHLDEINFATEQDVITSCDYETCPTIKSDNEVNTIIVVKSYGNLRSIETRSDHGNDNHYKSLENRAVGGAPK